MSELYEGREQSQVKHFILRKYLERFARIIGMSREQPIAYVDCFSGPWNVQSIDLKDSSFAIALDELLKAQHTCKQNGKSLPLRCFFLEENKRAYGELAHYAADKSAFAEIMTKNASLADSVPEILNFIHSSPKVSFPFIFLDPTGWSGLELDVISPLLKLRPGEVLINFMSSFIRRFIKLRDPATYQSFQRVFGPFLPSISELQNLESEALEDALLDAYSNLLRDVGGFPLICKAIVLHPQIDSTYFHLIYATRNKKGVEAFKAAERGAMNLQQSSRAKVKGKKRTERDGPELFTAEVMDDPRHFKSLCVRYCAKSKSKVTGLLNTQPITRFDEVWVAALTEPLVQEADLKSWIAEWQAAGQLKIIGMAENQRVPQWGQKIRLSVTSTTPLM